MTAEFDQCAWFQDRVDAYLDGTLDTGDIARFDTHRNQCPGCDRELAYAGALLESLRALPRLAAPPSVMRRVQQAMRVESRPPAPLHARIAAWLDPVRSAVWRPATAVILATFVLMTVFSVRQQDPEKLAIDRYADTEIQAAANEVLIAFAYVNRYSRYAGTLLRDDVMAARVLPHIAHALDETSPFLSIDPPNMTGD